jgi:hypothetical protein
VRKGERRSNPSRRSCETVFLSGDPGPKIVDYANENQFDPVVIGSRGLNPLQEFVLGSVSHKVAKRADCSVGVDRTTSVLVLSIVERVRVHTMLGITFLVSVTAPLIWLVSSEEYMVFPFAVAWGVAQGFMNIPLAVIWPNYFGRQHLGSIQKHHGSCWGNRFSLRPHRIRSRFRSVRFL